MLDETALFADLDDIGLGAWREPLTPLLGERMADRAHGDLQEWRETLLQLPQAAGPCLDASGDIVTIGADATPADEQQRLRELLLRLLPWRKGPFRIHGIDIDTEWRSDLKWNRLREAVSPLAGRNVLDVGCGNGYYALRMLAAGARCVIGIDPTLLYVCQFLALKKLAAFSRVHVLPLRLHELPARSRRFDTCFSMGVLYHRRDPCGHLRELRDALRSGGELVLETLVLPGAGAEVFSPDGRYARMRNVWHLPTVAALSAWLDDAGFTELSIVDVTATNTNEQRSTAWMPFESLAEALDPDDASRTVEGLPAPTRAIVLGTAP